MEWKRCTKCRDLKPLDRFWKNGKERYHSKCIACMKQEQSQKKEEKKEYDARRYEEKKFEHNKDRTICMRCGKYYSNVQNNQLHWCFSCLEKYEKELNRKIPVIVLNSNIKKVKYKHENE